MQLKTETKAPASNAATDHIETEFHIDDALENRTSTQSTAEYRTSASIARSSNTAYELQQTSANHRTTASCSQSLATDRTADQLIQNIGENHIIASSSRSVANELLENTSDHTVLAFSSHSLRATHYLNLFGSPDPTLSDALLWARTNARQPQVASWLEACSQWDSAIAAGEHRYRKKRRKLCKDHNILCTHLNLSEG